jgi:hypothetical protein
MATSQDGSSTPGTTSAVFHRSVVVIRFSRSCRSRITDPSLPGAAVRRGSVRRTARTAAVACSSAQSTIAEAAVGSSGWARALALAAYAGAPRACEAMCATATACPAARAAAVAAGSSTLRAAACAWAARARAGPTCNSLRAKARAPSMASRGRVSPTASISNRGRVSSAQFAAHTATTRRSSSDSVNGPGGFGTAPILLVGCWAWRALDGLCAEQDGDGQFCRASPAMAPAVGVTLADRALRPG